MDKEAIIEAGKGTDYSGSITFKIDPEDKEALIDMCRDKGLSMGKVLRAMIKEFLNA